jgi:hypothetical protein
VSMLRWQSLANCTTSTFTKSRLLAGLSSFWFFLISCLGIS